uniref:PDGF_2 domain-containing protein n=1 Tax=Macrostomum lignano TaxID=282301 RepID=A0A1I8FF81_9PLAT
MLMRPVSTFGLAGPKDAADVASESDVFWTCSEGSAALKLEAAAPFAVWRRLSLIFILAAVLCCAVQQSFASDGYMGASMDELLGEAVEPKPDKGKAKAKAPAAAAFVSAKASAPAAAPAPQAPKDQQTALWESVSQDSSREALHLWPDSVPHHISYEGDSCSRKKKVKRLELPPKCSRSGYRIETSLTVYLDDCVCKRRKSALRNECTPACPKTKVRTRCDGNVKMRISTVYWAEAKLSAKVETKVKRIPHILPKEPSEVAIKLQRADCSQTVTETWAEVRNCRCVRPVKKRTVKCCCPKPQRNSYCRGSVLHSMVRRFQLRGGRCKEKVKVTKKPIVCNKKYRPVKSSCAFNGYPSG